MNQLDRYDYAILSALQRDGTLSVAQLSEQVGLSSTPCWKRLRRLEEEGFIENRVAIINRRKVGLPVTVFVSIRITQHDENWFARFADAVGAAGSAGIPPHERRYRLSFQGGYQRYRRI
jgi:Lrp/AsnC family transcriptional regulator